MRNSSKLFVAVAAAGLVATAGTAFTASQTIQSGSKVGYGDTTVSGLTVTDVQYVVSTTDGSKIDVVKFITADSTATSSKGTLTIRNSADALVVASFDCGNAVSDGVPAPNTKYVYTCNPTTDPAATDVVKVGLTVTKNAV